MQSYSYNLREGIHDNFCSYTPVVRTLQYYARGLVKKIKGKRGGGGGVPASIRDVVKLLIKNNIDIGHEICLKVHVAQLV